MADENIHIEWASIYGANSRQGLVELTVRQGETVITAHFDLPKARDVLKNLTGAIEAALTDELLVRFLTEKIGLTLGQAARALLDFREMRQGSRSVVYPS